MRLAVIPARGGSKRIPRKNIRPFAGKPMIAYAIEAALGSALFERVIVSTDDPEIADVARGLGAAVPFMRPADLSDDHTPTVPVIRHAIVACRTLGWFAERVCCIYPAVPTIESADLSRALELLEQGNCQYAFPVAPFASPTQRALRRATDGTTRPLSPEYASTRSQDLEPAYHDAGQFYWGTATAWLAGINIHQHGKTIVLPAWRVVDIDTPEDWTRAEFLLSAIRMAG